MKNTNQIFRFLLIIVISLLFNAYVKAQVFFTQPTSTTSWEMGTSQTIQITNNTGSDINNTFVKLFINDMEVFDTHFDITLTIGSNDLIWDIENDYPEAPSSNCQLKVFDNGFNELAVSETFELAPPSPQITSITSPNGDSYWYNGLEVSINWYCYSLSAVDIEYSVNNGASWTSIENNHSVSSGHNHANWTVNGITGENPNALIRISETSNPSLFLNSVNFTLAENAPVFFTQPTSSTSWKLGTEQHILLTNTTGVDINNTSVMLFIDDMEVFNTHFDITLTTGLNDLIWDIDIDYPQAPSSNCQLRVFDNGFNELAVSETFVLTAPDPIITLIYSPKANSYWVNGDEMNIGWRSYSISEVNVELSTDNGLTWSSIASNVSANYGNNSMIWIVNGISGVNENALIKISDSSNPEVIYKLSDNFFLADVPQYSITEPNSSTSWEMISEQHIMISNYGAFTEHCDIELYINGSFEDVIIPDQTFMNGSNDILWDIPLYTASANCQLKVVTFEFGELAVSEVFELAAPAPQITSISSPLGNSFWYNGQEMPINWSCYFVPEVNIEYSTDNGSSWTTIVNNFPVSDGNNSTTWMVSGITGFNDNSLVKISAVSDPENIFIESESFILGESLGDVLFVQPNSGTTWPAGSEQHILINNYTGSDIEFFIIELFKDGEFVEIIPIFETLFVGQNDFIWNIDPGYQASGNYNLILYDDGFQEIAVSEIFELTSPAPQIASISSPNNDSYWYNGQDVSISWECYSIAEVNIEYSTDNGENWTSLSNNFPVSDGNNSTSWTVNGIVGMNPNSLIKISYSSDPSNLFLESSNFTLAEIARVVITQPNAGTSWEVGTEQHILMTNNTASNIGIMFGGLFIDGSPVEIFPLDFILVNGENDYTWSIDPGYQPSGNYNLILYDDGLQEIAVSESFELTASTTPQIVSVSSPNNDSYWYNGQNVTISWECYSIAEVNIEYSTDNGENWTSLSNNFPVSDGNNSTSWTVSGIVGINPNSLIKISDSSNPSNVFLESSNFTLAELARVVITQPNSGTSWEVGTEQHILMTNNTASNIEIMVIGLFIDGSPVDIIPVDIILESGENDYTWDIDPGYEPSEMYNLILFDDGIQEIAVSETFELTEPITVNTLQTGITISPNPTTDFIKLSMPEGHKTIVLTDISGKECLRTTNDNETFLIDLTAFKSGMYIITVKTENQVYTSKVFKK